MKPDSANEHQKDALPLASTAWVAELEAEAARAERLINGAARSGSKGEESAWRSYRNGLQYALRVARRPSVALTHGSVSGGKSPVRKEGILIPADDSFAAINEFVHDLDVSFEELQYALLGLAARRPTQNAESVRSSALVRELTEAVERRGREILASKKNYREREGRMREWAWFLKTLRAQSEKLSNVPDQRAPKGDVR